MASKRITVDYFKVVRESIGSDQDDTLVDLFNELSIALGKNPAKTAALSMRDTRNDKGRLQILLAKDDDTVEMQFLRLREIQPEVAMLDGTLETFKFGDDTYVAESASALYDSLTSMLILQRNYFGVGSGFIQSYLTALMCKHEDRTRILFTPIMGTFDNLSRIRSSKIKAFEAKVVFEGEPTKISNDVKAFEKYNPAVVSICVRAKKKHGDFLSQKETAHQIFELAKNGNTKSLKARIQDDDVSMEWVDLLEDRLIDTIDVEYDSENGSLRHTQIFTAIESAYKTMVTSSKGGYFDARRERMEFKK